MQFHIHDTTREERLSNYLKAVYHGTQVGDIIAELGKKILPSNYPIGVLNDKETIEGMITVLNAVKDKLQIRLDTL